MVRSIRLKLNLWVRPGRGMYTIWAPYKQRVARAGPAGRSSGRASGTARGQAGVSGTEELRLFLPEYLSPEKYFKWRGKGVGSTREARSKSQKLDGKADACLGQYLN